MPSFFSSKKKEKSFPVTPPPQASEPKASSSSDKATSPDKKSKGYFVRDRDSKRPISPRSSKSYRRTSETHPLNLPPEEIRRLSALSAMSSAQENGVDFHSDPMETTPAPEEPTAVNGVTGEHTQSSENEGDEGPAPPPHRTPTSPSPQPEMPKVDAEACKAKGNKFYKAGQYEKAIEEYSRGSLHFTLRPTVDES